MREQALLKALEQVSKTVQRRRTLKRINNGGCGWIAAYVKQHLDALGIDCKFVHIDRWGKKFDTGKLLKEAIYDKDETTSASHVILFIAGQYFFDSAGWGTTSEYYRKEYGGTNWAVFDMSASDYITFALKNKPDQWNTAYNTRKCNKILFNAVNKAFTRHLKGNNITIEPQL